MPVFFETELDTVATFWRLYRKDGAIVALTSHDRPLYFDGTTHLSAPGIVPSAIRKSSGLDQESAEVEGALSHEAISSKDLAAGQFDDARVEIGIVNWETLERASLYSGKIGTVSEGPLDFSAELRSVKQDLERDLVPYTSPTCRAEFCGPGCGLSAAKFATETRLSEVDPTSNSIRASGLSDAAHLSGRLTFLEGRQAGQTFALVASDADALILDRPIHPDVKPGTKVRILEGCDHTLATCHGRFGNSKNFRGEPFLPGNDLLTRYPKQK